MRSARGRREPRVEARLEGPGKARGETRVARQHRLHVALAEGQAGLQEVAAHCTQHQRLAPVEACRQHEAVEAVALGTSLPDGEEGLLEALARLHGIEPCAAGEGYLHVLDPAHGTVAGRDPVRPLVQHAQVEVLEQRQQVRHRHRLRPSVQAQVHAAVARARGQREPERLGPVGQPVELEQVGDGALRAHFLLVGGREGLRIAVRQCLGLRRRALRGQRRAQPVLPGAQRLGDARLDALDVGRDLAARIGAHQQVQARQRRLGNLYPGLERLATQFLEQDALDALAGLGVVAVARHVQQAGEEALVGVAAQQQPHAPPLVEVDDAAEARDQLGHAGLEQLVPRVRLEHVHQRLAVVADRRDAEVIDHALHLVAQQRDRAGAGAVSAGGKETDEAPLAGHPPAPVEGLHAHVVEVGRPVHGRHGIRLGDHQQRRLARPLAHLAAQFRHPRPRSAGSGAQQAEARARHRHEPVGSGAPHQAVLAVTEEGEVVVGQPLEEGGRLGDLGARDAGHGLRRHGLGELPGAIHHARPVVDRDAHVAERRLDARQQRRDARRVVDAIDFEVLP